MKKVLLVIITLGITLFSWYFASAENNYKYESQNKLIIDNSLNFSAKLENWNVYTSWKSFNKNEKFKYYKIVRSSKKSNPVYPDDWYIKYYDDLNKVEFKDSKPLNWTAYYRVCAITHENDRYCSNVVKVQNEKEMIACTKEYSPVCWYRDWKYKTYSNKCMLKSDDAYYKYSWKCKEPTDNWKEPNKESKKVNNIWNIKSQNIPNTLKKKSNNLIVSFIKKLDNKWYSNEKNVEIINWVIKKLNVLEEKKPSLSNIINYLIELLKEYKEKYDDSFSDIENIFNID